MNIRVICDVAVSPNVADPTLFPSCAYPCTIVTHDGTIVCIYRGGKEKHSYDGVILAQKSSDHGQSWSSPVFIFDGRNSSPAQCAFSGGLCQTSDGSLLYVFCAVDVTAPDHYVFSEEGIKQRRTVWSVKSFDGGLTWSVPRQLNTSPFHQGGYPLKPFVLPTGDIFVSMETRSSSNGRITAIGAFSSDNGETNSPFFELGFIDPGNQLEMGDAHYTITGNTILALLWAFRASDEETLEVHRSISGDMGRTWSIPQPTGFIGQVTAPLALKDSVVIAASNCRQPPEGIRLWLSPDGGNRWQKPPIQMWDTNCSRILAEPVPGSSTIANKNGVWDALPTFTFGTPDLVVLPDGSILLSYYATLNGIIHVRACHFELSENQ